MDDEAWLSTRQVAELLGIVPRTVYGLINSGQLTAYRHGRVLRIRSSDLGLYLDGARVQPGELDHLARQLN